jgi:hypothetical protein
MTESTSASFQTLPVEIILRICDCIREQPSPTCALFRDFQLKGRREISRLSRTNKAIRAIVEPGLYSEIELISSDKKLSASLKCIASRHRAATTVVNALYRTLSEKPDLARHIKRLSTHVYSLSALCTNLTSLDTTSPEPITSLPHPERLEELRFDDDGSHEEGTLDTVDWSRLTSLRDLSIALCNSNIKETSSEAIISFSKMPSLRKLKMELMNPSDNPISFQDLVRLIGPQLEELHMVDSYSNSTDSFPETVEFRLRTITSHMSSIRVDYHHLASLRHLHFYHFDGPVLLPPLTKLPPRIHSIHIHLEAHNCLKYSKRFIVVLSQYVSMGAERISRVMIDPRGPDVGKVQELLEQHGIRMGKINSKTGSSESFRIQCKLLQFIAQRIQRTFIRDMRRRL